MFRLPPSAACVNEQAGRLVGLVAAALLLLAGGTGCSQNDCQNLCDDWYDYQVMACGTLERDIRLERVRCNRDYSAAVGEDELEACTEAIAELATDDANPPEGRCCPQRDAEGQLLGFPCDAP